MPEFSVILPVLNEEEHIALLYERLVRVLDPLNPDFELIFVNDGSRDQTLLRVREHRKRDPRVKFIDFARSFGHQVAISAGLEYARGRVVIVIDADLQDPPELIPEMYQKIQQGYEVVYARRIKRRGETRFKKFTAYLFYRLLNAWSHIDIPLDVGDFRMMDRQVVDVLARMPEQHKFLRGQISWIGFNQTFVNYERDSRYAGRSKYPLRKMLRFALDAITGFTTFPLKLATLSGFVASFIAFLLIIWVILVRTLGHRLGITVQPGWASQMIVILFLGGIQLIGIGILGEYIARINDNIKHRPLYVIRQTSEDLEPPPK